MATPERELVYTIGHSNRSFDELVALLDECGIATLVDVRRNPWSRRYPHFCRPSLERSFEGLPIRYMHIEALGGHREASPDSPNTALPEAIRGYADHLTTREFEDAIRSALDLPRPVALMCAEALPTDCHRSILSDELVRRGFEVVHILGSGRRTPHYRDRRAVDDGSRLIYPSKSVAQLSLPLD